MAVRFLDLYSPEIESTYASLPLEFINEKISQDQGKFDTAVAKASAMSADPIGLKEIVDQNGKPIAVEDFNRAQAWANNFNEQVANTVQDLYSSGDFSRVTPVIANLNREYAKAQSSEGILGINKARMEAYQKMHENYAQQKNMPSSIWRSNPYYDQIQLMRAKEKYVPTTSLPYSEHIDRTEVANKIISGMETNQEAWANPGNRGGKYISSGTHETRTEADIQDVFDFAINQSGLFADLSNEVEYLYKTKQEVDYLNDKGELVQGPITNQKEAQDYFNYKKGELKEFVKKKFATDKWTKNLKNDDIYTKGYEYELNNPSLPIISEHGATGVTKGSTFNDWRKALDAKNTELQNASQNTTGRGLQLIQAAGITDKNTVDYIVRHKDEFYNSDGSLNLNKIQTDPNIKLSKPLNTQDIMNLQAGFAFYNEAYDQEKNIERERNNMQVRVDNLTQNFTSQYNTSAIDKEFENNKNLYSGFGINSSKELLDYITNNPENAAGGYVYDDQGNAHNIQGLAGVSQKLTTDLNDYFEKNSTATSYVTLENAANNRGVGTYNKGITEHFKKDPVALLNSRVDGTTMLLKDYLKKNGINPDQISLDNLSAVMVGNTMLDGGTGLMISVKDGKGKKLAEVPISDDGIQWGARDQILNQAYFDLDINPSTSRPSNQQYADALELSKGNTLVGSSLRQIDTRNMQPGEQNTIESKQGTLYTITKLPIGGYTVTTYGSGNNAYTSNPEKPLTDDNAILQYIGNIEFSKNAYQLQK